MTDGPFEKRDRALLPIGGPEDRSEILQPQDVRIVDPVQRGQDFGPYRQPGMGHKGDGFTAAIMDVADGIGGNTGGTKLGELSFGPDLVLVREDDRIRR